MNDEAIQKIMNYTNMHLFEPGEKLALNQPYGTFVWNGGRLTRFYWPLWIIR